MRHRKVNKILDRAKAPRQAMLENLATSLILYEKVVTTEAKAKAVRPLVERLITRGKEKSVHNKQQLNKVVHDKKATQKILDVLGPKYKTRAGGYCRIIKISRRMNDGAKMAQIELV
ncbi:MAG: 50S ribosomal protein L17 [Candidatus Komeilibacteria bacterium CG11_big_fil_rev_8_21_14_0_20_36_20]|uniref:50S ribosomal protein L17 n=1 Tax=Candidatus Komeilibacteria bacterium CG11_big_fil_rev_8_21_14_0_20_36_20 TaxID=1974477 RepID=A0A2H0NC01_9BACT|nr:MAG: 50S ribosomal protein L17 [Candidatus Komeilibacteria bacterium CG11_big_fil_rev_8_21_14_0_20_36_20]PIR81994.1 MAG: 50S ribosomal protein L17 [Candidatus Komeilibacteria bacterium CG10_big_fil_rev_8_21_14_0_10_36_65]PJC55532.1 MAG: 50S ribosomal protein L17 [Candidatus Komeilibacteria bacterium CG_4_9_14_0_2_um_filter_36_13]